MTLHYNYNYSYNHNYNYTTATTTLQLQLQLLHVLQLRQLQLQPDFNYTTTTTLQLQQHQPHYNYNYNYCTTPHYIQELWVRGPLQPLQPLQKAQLQPPFGPSVNSLFHPCITTTHLSYRVLSLKFPPPPCAALQFGKTASGKNPWGWPWCVKIGRGFDDGTAALRHCPPLVAPELQLASRTNCGVILGRYEQTYLMRQWNLRFGTFGTIAKNHQDLVQENLAASGFRTRCPRRLAGGTSRVDQTSNTQWVNEPNVSTCYLVMITIRYNWPFFRLWMHVWHL